jgi:hypothetical protein
MNFLYIVDKWIYFLKIVKNKGKIQRRQEESPRSYTKRLRFGSR